MDLNPIRYLYAVYTHTNTCVVVNTKYTAIKENKMQATSGDKIRIRLKIENSDKHVSKDSNVRVENKVHKEKNRSMGVKKQVVVKSSDKDVDIAAGSITISPTLLYNNICNINGCGGAFLTEEDVKRLEPKYHSL